MRYDQADIFLVPLFNGQYGVGQVVTTEATPLCAFTLRQQPFDAVAAPLTPAEIIALHKVDAAHLADGTWPVIGLEQIPQISALDRLNALESDPLDPAIIEALLNAWHGLYPWDGFPDRTFFDGLLCTGVSKPASARTKGQLA
ncbi:hypothetical protein [Flavimaricola marinus]|uniref:Uncharacterized protein n=1 Tax=Flavimaricola marinus TaxID=1819565 RepID=A0A238LDH5_9RHOB|nr:hypothetical protein [Flavimaricola marinus]SMY07603.1 hypothetical protein LOM8899_01740 [Flavimaricola marinus]